MSDDVMDLLDSLGPESPKAGAKKQNNRKGTKHKKDEEILGMLDELAGDKSKDSTKHQSKEKPAKKPTETAKPTEPAKPAKPEPSTKEDQGQEKAQPDAQREEAQDKPTEQSKDEEAHDTPEVDPVSTITSWWSRNKGGIWDSASRAATKATNAVRQAEAKVIADQQRFSLNSIQTGLTSVLNTIVPPISRHEQLQIHVTHDLVGYPNIDRAVHDVFEQVMDQVEGGGELHLVTRKGHDRRQVGSDDVAQRHLNCARCSIESGAKLAMASITEAEKLTGTQTEQSETENPDIRISQIYIAIQPILTPSTEEDNEKAGEFLFIVTLKDFKHDTEIVTASQAFPADWATWLDTENEQFASSLFDPREWIITWVEQGAQLALGVVAQRYVADRMGLSDLLRNNK